MKACDCRPLVILNGMWEAGPMARFKAPLDAHWQPHLRRGASLEPALEALVVAAQ